jgi:hypothetical protein
VSRGVKRRAEVGRCVRLVDASKADLLEAVIDLLRLQHPESADIADDEWLADRLQAALDEQRERRGQRRAKSLRERRSKIDELARKQREWTEQHGRIRP